MSRVIWPESRVRDLLTRRGVLWPTVLRVAEVGSTAHGISTPETDDHDFTAVRYEDFSELINHSYERQSMMIRTQPDGARSRLGDIDLNVYTLRKFAHLAAKGNPSILAALFSGRIHRDKVVDFDELARYVASQRAGTAFYHYMRQQVERWTGSRGQKNVNRPELVEAHGFDTKYAAHVIRLGYQGIEYMETGRFTMPMPEELARQIVELRRGGVPEPAALAWAKDVEADLASAIAKSTLPPAPAEGAVARWLVTQYQDLLGVI